MCIMGFVVRRGGLQEEVRDNCKKIYLMIDFIIDFVI